ncbi:hypothetical protein RHS04_07763 [Rhizoctonia solani]|uniref:Uncharacterized protein n=1 Tax=Rhizoctonia solani TaxID=456999 RepID=A0A8H7LJY6_9AGAM|nr:hypothetical protein RHS04_07763 [Rhizoctonia solani]
MGSPQADARSTQMPRHAETARAAHHDRGNDVSTGITTARAWAAAAIRIGPRPESIGRPACHRSTSDRGASPAPIRFPPDNFKHSLTLFSNLGRNLPPDWGCIPKQPDSPTAPRGATGSGHDGALTLSGAPFQGTWARSAAEDASPDYNSDAEWRPILKLGLNPGSLAVTKGILRVVPPDLGSRWKRRERDATGSKEHALSGDARTTGHEGLSTTDCRGDRRRGLVFRPAAGISPREANVRPACPHRLFAGRWGWGQRCVTPRQTCPRPVSHFATFFIDARAEISVAESRYGSRQDSPPVRAAFPRRPEALFRSCSLAQTAPGYVVRQEGTSVSLPFEGGARDRPPPPVVETGSPTETLLRLLLPLNDKVQWTSRDVAGSEPPTSPRSEHFTGPFNR